MTFHKMIAASAALLALAACGRGNEAGQANTTAAAQGEGANVTAAPPAAAAASGAQSFANVAAASDAFEIETSRLALANGASASVKAYAGKMIEAHTTSTAKLKATTAGLAPAITPDPTLNPEQQQKLDGLKALQGAAFDRAYKTEQAAGHQQTLDALKAYAATGEVPQLKTLATGMIPIVAAHLNMANALKV